jgi:hypothetical protein
MNLIDILSSLSKISLTAFLVTLFFVIYQVYVIKREFSRKRGKPVIPDFDESLAKKRKIESILIRQQQIIPSINKNKSLYLIIVIIFISSLLIFVISGAVLIMNQKNNTETLKPTPIVNFVASRGIRVYNEKWGELTDLDLQNLKAGEDIYIGINTIANTDIDKARIRVNENVWKLENVTEQFNKDKNIFYIKYTVASQSSILKIDAQLHSKSDNWLGE